MLASARGRTLCALTKSPLLHGIPSTKAPSVRELAAKQTEGEKLANARNFKQICISLPHRLRRSPLAEGAAPLPYEVL